MVLKEEAIQQAKILYGNHQDDTSNKSRVSWRGSFETLKTSSNPYYFPSQIISMSDIARPTVMHLRKNQTWIGVDLVALQP